MTNALEDEEARSPITGHREESPEWRPRRFTEEVADSAELRKKSWKEKRRPGFAGTPFLMVYRIV
jgi:hypothetical protein